MNSNLTALDLDQGLASIHSINPADMDEIDVKRAHRAELLFPTLTHLCSEFNLQIVSHFSNRPSYQLSANDDLGPRAISPRFAFIEQLELYVKGHLVDIFNGYLDNRNEPPRNTH